MGSKKGKIKVLLVAVCKTGVVGGQATSARMLLSGLADNVDWTLVSLPPPGTNTINRMIASLRIFFQSLFACFRKGIRVAHIFTSCTRAALYEKLLLGMVLRLFGIRTVLNFRGAFDEFFKQCYSFEKKIIVFFLRRQSVLLCQHKGISAFLLREGIVRENKIRVIANAVERADLAPDTAVKTGKMKVLCLSWIVSSKGLDLLIDTAAEIQSALRRHNALIEICGPQEERGLKENLQRRINELGCNDVVCFIDPVSGSGKKALFMESAIFVFPSRKEGFPNALIEAMMFGIPVIATDRSPMNSLVHDQITGLLFEAENKVELGKRMMSLLEDEQLRRRLGTEGRKFVMENFTIEKVMPQFLALYEEVAA